MRLAEENDAAQERNEIGQHGGNRQVSSPETCKAIEVLQPKDLHEARKLRDAEKAEPGIVARTSPKALTLCVREDSLAYPSQFPSGLGHVRTACIN